MRKGKDMNYRDIIYEIMKDNGPTYKVSGIPACTTAAVCKNSNDIPEVKKVIWNKNACIVIWKDDTKTIVKCQEGDVWDKEVGLMAAFSKKLFGNDNTFNKIINRYCSVFFNEDKRIQKGLEKMDECFSKAFDDDNIDKLTKSIYLTGQYKVVAQTPYCVMFDLPDYAKEFIKLANKHFKFEMSSCNLRLSVVETKDNTFKIVLVEQKGEEDEVQE